MSAPASPPERFVSEPTPEGEQSNSRSLCGAEGSQLLVPGVAPISIRERLEHLSQAPLGPRRLQKPLDIGLFDLAARNQLDLF